MARNALGKGLGALIGSSEKTSVPPQQEGQEGENVQIIPLSQIHPSTFQPRKDFNEEKLEELASSIKEKGVIQPLIVRKGEGGFELIAGERRWRASQRAQISSVPVIVREVTDLEVLELALIENLQRDDLNPIEEAEGYARLMEKFELTQDQVAQKVGKSRASVANALRLRGLGGEVRTMVAKGTLSVGHAKVLLGLSTDTEQLSIAREIIGRNLSVRETEKIIRSMTSGMPKKRSARRKSQAAPSADWRELELKLQQAMGTRVRLVGTASKGHLEVAYFNESDLERILSQFGVSLD